MPEYLQVVARLAAPTATDQAPVYCDEGTVRLTPLLAVANDAEPTWVSGLASHDGTVGDDGQVTWPGNVLDLADPELQPHIAPGFATHMAEFIDLKAGGVEVYRDSAPVRIAADTTEDGVCDLAALLPVTIGQAVPLVRGPKGDKGDPSTVPGPVGPVPVLTVGAVTTGVPGATIDGPPEAPVLNLTMPTASWAAIDLAATDLNSTVSPGIYYQDSATNATAARNYPTDATGRWFVEVLRHNVGGAHVIQRATMFGGPNNTRVVYTRRRVAGIWYAWVATTAQRVDQTAGRAIYTWDEVNSREQLVYYDSGWREVPLLNGWAGSIRARRTGSTVEVIGKDLVAGTTQTVCSLGVGLTPQQVFPIMGRPPSTAAVPAYGSVSSSTGAVQFAITNTFHGSSLQFTYSTIDPVPTSLLGTASGIIPNL